MKEYGNIIIGFGKGGKTLAGALASKGEKTALIERSDKDVYKRQLGLWVILRPSPYICAEWDFGGLPAWLLAQGDMALRTSDERFLCHVRAYYDRLMPLLAPLQIDHGGPVIMLQVENEYGLSLIHI